MQESKVGNPTRQPDRGGVLGGSVQKRTWVLSSLRNPTIVRSSQKQSLDSNENHFEVIIVTNSEIIRMRIISKKRNIWKH